MLLLPVGFLISGLVSLREPGLSALLFGIMVAAILIVGIWLSLGAEKF